MIVKVIFRFISYYIHVSSKLNYVEWYFVPKQAVSSQVQHNYSPFLAKSIDYYINSYVTVLTEFKVWQSSTATVIYKT